ncbi:MAG: hypothetical protein SOU51_00475 [Collinsella sp.]|nr:hypothetical protein [Collinsella sp.]
MYQEIVRRLWEVKWSLVLMAAFCFAFAFYVYVTPVYGGLGMFPITPRDGAAGLLGILPWVGIFLGAVSIVASFASRSTWVLGWTEPAIGAFMLLVGFWSLFQPGVLSVFSRSYGAFGIFLAVYISLIALEMERKSVGHWWAELVVAAATWCISLLNLMDLAGADGYIGLTALTFAVAAWGFVYGALSLSGVAPAHGDNLVCPWSGADEVEAA